MPTAVPMKLHFTTAIVRTPCRALVHGLTIATRNERDFEAAGVPIENPFNWAGGL